MTRRCESPRLASLHPRSGAALIIAMICLLLVTTISAVLVRVALAQRDQLERDGWRRQADWLALSALERTLARRAADPGYTGETWLPQRATAGAPIGRVEIAVSAAAEGSDGSPRVRIVVDVPDDPVNRSHVVIERRIPIVTTSSDPAGSDVVE